MSSDPFTGVPAPLRAALLRRGFTQLTKVQQAILAEAPSDRNFRISSETGSGKTVALGLVLGQAFLGEGPGNGVRGKKARPGPEALLITPTRELAGQVREELGWLYADVPDTSVAVVTGGTSVGLERRELGRRPRMVVGTPGRILDHIRTGALRCDAIAHVVLDEADHMLDMGFRDELDAIVESLPAERRSHLVSATFPRAVLELANRFQADPVHVQGTTLGAAHQDIEHVGYVVRAGDRYAALVNLLLLGLGQRCLVFVRRRVDTMDLADELSADGFSVLPLSGDLPQAQRTRTLEMFRTGQVTTLIATDVAARGIDVSDIASVVHFDPPTDADTYTHRSGRTGRAGRKGRSLLLVPPAAERRVRILLAAAKIDAQWLPVPDPSQVKKALVKQTRRRLHALLASDARPGDAEIAYAATLLEQHDPATLVATLLGASTAKLPREPMTVSGPRPRPARADGRPPQASFRDRSNGAYVAFTITWGQRAGATPQRLLAQICRRGDVESASVGAIDIGPPSAVAPNDLRQWILGAHGLLRSIGRAVVDE
jgi:ATP-dependent RNA helicase DeaD